MSDPVTRLNAALEGRYRVESERGEGGMATVYLADDLKHERKVALKVLKPTRSSARTRFTAMAVVAGCSTVSCLGPFSINCSTTRVATGGTVRDLTATAVIEASVRLTEHRYKDNHRFTWEINIRPTDSADSLFTAVHLHEAETDDILYTFPLSVERSSDLTWDVSWYHAGLGTDLYLGSVPFALLYELVGSGGTYIDVHTVAHPEGAKAALSGSSSLWEKDCDGD